MGNDKSTNRAERRRSLHGDVPPDAAPGDRTMPHGAYATFLGIAGIGFVLLLGVVFAYGVHGERLTAGIDTACAQAAFAAGKKMEALGNYDEALVLFRRALEGRFRDKERQYMCGRSIAELYVRLGRYEDAIDAYQSLPPEALTSPGALTGYVSALYRTGKYAEAERLGRQWRQQAEAAQDRQQLVWAHHILGLIYRETHRPDAMLPHFRAVREVDPGNEANLAIAQVLRQEGLYEEALAQVDALLAHAPQGHLHKQATDMRAQIAAAAGPS